MHVGGRHRVQVAPFGDGLGGRAGPTGGDQGEPLIAGVAPLGFAIGAAGAASGLPPLAAWSSSLLLYGGSIQLVVLQLLDSGAAPAVVVAAALLATLPRCLYALVLGPGLGRRPARQRLLDAYLLVEPSFAVGTRHRTTHPSATPTERRAVYLGAGTAVFLTWLVVTALGAVAGGQLPTGFGIEVLVPVMMLTLATGSDRSRGSWCAGTVGGLASLVLAGLPHHLGFLIAVVAGVAAATALDRKVVTR